MKPNKVNVRDCWPVVVELLLCLLHQRHICRTGQAVVGILRHHGRVSVVKITMPGFYSSTCHHWRAGASWNITAMEGTDKWKGRVACRLLTRPGRSHQERQMVCNILVKCVSKLWTATVSWVRGRLVQRLGLCSLGISRFDVIGGRCDRCLREMNRKCTWSA